MKKLLISLFVLGFMMSSQTPILAQLQTPISAQNYDYLFQKGVIQEEGEGNLKEAIEIYNKIVYDVFADRKLRAKALLQVGICYEKLGDQNDRKTYQKLISEYSDQEAIVAIGKERLKGLKKSDPTSKKDGIVARQVLFPEQNAGGVSPDGRYLIYVDWTTENDEPAINIKDLRNGTSRIVSKVGTWESPIKFPDQPIWSPNGKQFAYFWYDDDEEGCELHIANIDGTNDKIVAKGSEAPYPYSWSANGKYILCTVTNRIQLFLALFSVNDGSSRILKSLDSLKLNNMDISPDNKYIVYAWQQTKGSHENDIHLISIDGKVDNKIISNSSNDFDPRWSPDGKNILFVSDRHGTNDLWKISIENGHAAGIAKLVKSNLGKLGGGTKILGITNDQSLYYETSKSRPHIHLVNMDFSETNNINSTTRISNLNATGNTNPAISKDGRYIAFISRTLFPDAGIVGHPFFFTIYDTKTGESKNTNTLMYTLSQLYWYWPKPQWSPNGKKLLIQGRKKEKENLLAAVFTYDIETEETEPIIVMRNYKEYTDIPSTGSGHVFSNDGKSIYYLSTDRKNVRKIEIQSKKETVIYTNSNPMARFKLSNDESKIVYVPFSYDNWNELYVAPTSGEKSKQIVSLNNDNLLNLIGWDSNDTHFYFGDGKYLNINTIMRVSIEEGTLEKIINLKNTFPDGEVREIVFDHSSSTMAVEVKVESVEMWKLEGVFKD